MAKEIRYKIVESEINHGTEAEPNVEQIIGDRIMVCPTEVGFSKMILIAEKEAVHGTIEVTGEFDPEPVAEPTADEVLNALLGVDRYA